MKILIVMNKMCIITLQIILLNNNKILIKILIVNSHQRRICRSKNLNTYFLVAGMNLQNYLVIKMIFNMNNMRIKIIQIILLNNNRIYLLIKIKIKWILRMDRIILLLLTILCWIKLFIITQVILIEWLVLIFLSKGSKLQLEHLKNLFVLSFFSEEFYKLSNFFYFF